MAKRKTKLINFGLFGIALIVLIWFFVFYKGTTAPIRDATGKIILGSVAKLEKVKINGVYEWLLIRGQDKNKPVLLYIDGGPGDSDMLFHEKYNKALEKDFITVDWDQRGVVKSYSPNMPAGSINMEQCISDMKEVVLHLRKEFNKEKIYVVGHSWGTMLGLLTVHRYPDLFYAYIGVSQLVDAPQSEDILYPWLMANAKNFKDKEALALLKKIGAPVNGVYKDIKGDNGNMIPGIEASREMLFRYGGAVHSKFTISQPNPIFTREYSLWDILCGLIDNDMSKLAEEMRHTNMMKVVKEVKVPIYFFEGRYDYQAPTILAEKYFNQLKAPKKELIWFENSAHAPDYEEIDKFTSLVVEKFLKENPPKNLTVKQ